MFLRRLFVPFIVAILLSCTTARPAPESSPAAPSISAQPLPVRHSGLIAVADDGAIWRLRGGTRTLERWVAGRAAPDLAIELPRWPETMRGAEDGGIVITGSLATTAIDRTGNASLLGSSLDAAGPERLDLRSGSLVFVTPTGETEVRFGEGVVTAARLLPGGRAVALARGPAGAALVRVSAGERKTASLAGPFAGIDSFDVSPDGTEVAFSARRDGGFDVGLVSVDGSETRWIGPDPLDERIVRWAPRGNKIAFAIETPAGAIVRSVHIPTGFQVSAPVSRARILDLAWDPAAERLALLVTSADASERVETMRFDGTERRVAIEPEARSGGADQLAGVPGAALFNPPAVRYNEKLPLVIWESGEGAFTFHQGRARLQQNRRIGSIVVSRGATERLMFWEAVAELAWVDPERIFVVADAFDEAAVPGGVRATVLTREGEAAGSDRVAIVRSGPGSLEDFAVLWLGERLRGFEREHDGS